MLKKNEPGDIMRMESWVVEFLARGSSPEGQKSETMGHRDSNRVAGKKKNTGVGMAWRERKVELREVRGCRCTEIEVYSQYSGEDAYSSALTIGFC